MTRIFLWSGIMGFVGIEAVTAWRYAFFPQHLDFIHPHTTSLFVLWIKKLGFFLFRLDMFPVPESPLVAVMYIELLWIVILSYTLWKPIGALRTERCTRWSSPGPRPPLLLSKLMRIARVILWRMAGSTKVYPRIFLARNTREKNILNFGVLSKWNKRLSIKLI